MHAKRLFDEMFKCTKMDNYKKMICCIVIQAGFIMVLYMYVIPLGTLMKRFLDSSDEVPFSMNAFSVLPSKNGHMPNEIKDIANKSQNNNAKSAVGLQEMDTINSNRFLILQRPTGRLGNQMFDFASGLGIAHVLNFKFVMRPSNPLLKYFELNQTLIKRVINVQKVSIERWRQNTWNKTNLSRNISLEKNWRIWKYFDSVSDVIRKSFTFKPKVLKSAKSFIQAHNPNNLTLIGVHVRRGDFLERKKLEKGRVVVNKEFLLKAMNWFRHQHKDARFVVVSNDQQWCKDNIHGEDVFFSTFTEPILDMAILSLCNHTVMSTGTFSWWGAWLAGGTVVYCSDFPRPGSLLATKVLFRKDFYPPSWIGMSNGI